MRLTLSCRWLNLSLDLDRPGPPPPPSPPPSTPPAEMPRYDSSSTVASNTERAQPTHIGFAVPWEPSDRKDGP